MSDAGRRETPAPARHPRDALRPALSLGDATFLVVASVIGSGIFLTPGPIANTLPHPGWIFAAWLAGGLLSLAGALANAELGAMYPHAGGDYVYLREAFHPAAGFLVGWLTFFVIYAGTIATLAAGFAGSLASFVPLGEAGTLAVAVGITVASTALNWIGVRVGARFNNATTLLKVLAIVAFVALGPFVGPGSWTNLASPAPGDGSGAIGLSSFGLALSPVLFSYLGWNATVYVASEMHVPERDVPRSLFLGLTVCAAIYLAVNAVYLYALPVTELRHVENAGQATAAVLFGSAGGRLVAAFVLASILGTLNATILVGPRIAYAMAIDGLFFRGVEQVHPRFGTPHVALLVQALVSVGLLLLLRSFPRVLDYTTFAIVLATMADTAALYALRRRQPARRRPYHAWGYPLVPALYLVANAAIAFAMLRGRPMECLTGLAIAASGLPFYLWWAARGGDSPGAPNLGPPAGV
ncbi:MAG TPA: APC family permease [Myxococcota bacterium]|jgi:APA family basic amino acid/polyamine antiporter|nr:APC family permease [Myxococcota bacterium]